MPLSGKTQYELNRIMKERAAKLTKLLEAFGIPLECVYTSWEDGMRAFGSALGPNIADIGLIFKTPNGTVAPTETYGFKIRSNNFHEVLVEIDARVFRIVVSDPDGQKPKCVFLNEVLKNAGKYFKHTGLPENCNLYDPNMDDGKIKLRMDLIFAPKGATPDSGPFSVKEFALTKGTACTDDMSGTQRLFPQVVVNGRLYKFWTEAEATGKNVDDMDTETAEEAMAAAVRGKGTAVETGVQGWNNLSNLFHLIQIPLVQHAESCSPVSTYVPWFHGMTAAQMWCDNPLNPAASLYPGVDPALLQPNPPFNVPVGELDDDAPFNALVGELDDDYNDDHDTVEKPTYRSVSAQPHVYRSMRAVTALASTLEGVRISRGICAGLCTGVQTKNVKRAANEPITITTTMVVMQDGDNAPKYEDVCKLWNIITGMMKIAGEPKDLHNPDAGLTTCNALTKQDKQSIEAKQKVHPAPPQVPSMPVAPIVGMVKDGLNVGCMKQ